MQVEVFILIKFIPKIKPLCYIFIILINSFDDNKNIKVLSPTTSVISIIKTNSSLVEHINSNLVAKELVDHLC